MEFFFPQPILSSYRERLMLHIILLPFTFYLLWLKIMCLIRRPVALAITPYCFQ